MLAGLKIFVPLEWSRFGLWLVAILVGGAALAAAGAALGAAAREVRAVSLLAFMVTLPIAFLSLVPSGAVGHGVFDAIKMVTALFPFKPALQAMTAALDSAGQDRRAAAAPGDPARRLRPDRPPRAAPLRDGLSRAGRCGRTRKLVARGRALRAALTAAVEARRRNSASSGETRRARSSTRAPARRKSRPRAPPRPGPPRAVASGSRGG